MPIINNRHAQSINGIAQAAIANANIEQAESPANKVGFFKSFFISFKSLFSRKVEVAIKESLLISINTNDGEGTIFELKNPSILPEGMTAEKAQEMIQKGYDIYKTLVTSNEDIPEATTEDIAALMWYMQVAGEQKAGDAYSSGAISLEDSNGRVFDYIESCKEKYTRISSHIKLMQKDSTHRGIDIDATTLPYGKATLLYGRMDMEGVERRVYLKIENHGVRLASVSDASVESRSIQWGHDLYEFVLHSLDFLKTRGSKGGRREKLPKNIKHMYEAFLKVYSEKYPELAKILKEGNPTDNHEGSGIRFMRRNLQEILKQTESLISAEKEILEHEENSRIEKSLKKHEEARDFIKASIQQLNAELNKLYDTATLDIRIGNEVILDKRNLI